MNLSTGEYEFVVSLYEIARYKRDKAMDEALHWFQPVMFDPNDERIMFLH